MTQSQTITVAAVALVAVVAVGGGLAYAAKDAEPGDMLYSLRASLYSGADSSETQEEDLDAAREAYEEAVNLQANGQLTASEQARINATYSMRVNAVTNRIADLESNGDLEAAALLRTQLRALLREANDVFRSAMDNNSSASADASSMMNDETSSSVDSNASMGGGQSSIFIQPSSSVTSA